MGQGAALALTLAVESLVILAVLRRRRGRPVDDPAAGTAAVPSLPVAWPRALAAAVLPSLLTHPPAWRAALALPAEGYAAGVLLIEAAVVSAEAVVLRALLRSTPLSSWRDAFTLSLLANAASYGVGSLLQ